MSHVVPTQILSIKKTGENIKNIVSDKSSQGCSDMLNHKVAAGKLPCYFAGWKTAVLREMSPSRFRLFLSLFHMYILTLIKQDRQNFGSCKSLKKTFLNIGNYLRIQKWEYLKTINI